MSITTEQEYYDNRLSEFQGLMEGFFNLMSTVRSVSNCDQHSYEDAFIHMEQTLADLLDKEVEFAKEITGSMEELPKSRFLKRWEESYPVKAPTEMFERVLESRRSVLQNPQSYADKGEAI